jgi:hypothetical protein
VANVSTLPGFDKLVPPGFDPDSIRFCNNLVRSGVFSFNSYGRWRESRNSSRGSFSAHLGLYRRDCNDEEVTKASQPRIPVDKRKNARIV